MLMAEMLDTYLQYLREIAALDFSENPWIEEDLEDWYTMARRAADCYLCDRGRLNRAAWEAHNRLESLLEMDVDSEDEDGYGALGQPGAALRLLSGRS